MTENIGLLHPGEMGVSVGAAARQGGHRVFWVSEDRSVETCARATRHGLIEVLTLTELCRTCSIILSVCPPDAAETVAGQVLVEGFTGLYADFNAISPERAQAIAGKMATRGISFVDGGIIGPPAWNQARTWLYLCGGGAQRVADCFNAGPLIAEVIDGPIGQASAVKMCYAAYTKGMTALLSVSLAAAEGLGVRVELERQWSRDEPGSDRERVQRVRRATAKAWRFAGEMDEIAATLAQVGLPMGFHKAAAELYRRLADFKGRAADPTIDEVLEALLGDRPAG